MNLNQVTLPCRDLDRSVIFYQNLGLLLIVRTDTYARFECSAGDATLSLSKKEQNFQPSDITIYFEVDDPDRVIKELKKKGIEITAEPEDKRWLWREASLQDPAGNNLIIYHAGENRKYPPWRINTNS
ncbi:VOC family protein [Robertkochia aurantiaca]|uniref:VOC family protein n=1 Tax=Robertkochia aurantiaca TaxID=2873700 RepID=UPI001CCCB99F|nr:VOC family protein [Robertkochia sp. 3YJGBD-33]